MVSYHSAKFVARGRSSPPRRVLRKTWSQNMQQIYRRTLMLRWRTSDQVEPCYDLQ